MFNVYGHHSPLFLTVLVSPAILSFLRTYNHAKSPMKSRLKKSAFFFSCRQDFLTSINRNSAAQLTYRFLPLVPISARVFFWSQIFHFPNHFPKKELSLLRHEMRPPKTLRFISQQSRNTVDQFLAHLCILSLPERINVKTKFLTQ